MKYWILLIVVLMAGWLVIVQTVAQDTLEFGATNNLIFDTYLRESAPTTNYGTNTQLLVTTGRAALYWFGDSWFDTVAVYSDTSYRCIEATCSLYVFGTASGGSGYYMPIRGVWKVLESNSTDQTWNQWDSDGAAEWGTAGGQNLSDVLGSWNTSDGSGADAWAQAFDSAYLDPDSDAIWIVFTIDTSYVNDGMRNGYAPGFMAGLTTGPMTVTLGADEYGGSTYDPRFRFVFEAIGGGGPGPGGGEGRANRHTSNAHEVNRHGD